MSSARSKFQKGRACVKISCVIHPSAQMSTAFVYSEASLLEVTVAEVFHRDMDVIIALELPE
jgi:hypothetical protein